jgi:hypothetical protein
MADQETKDSSSGPGGELAAPATQTAPASAAESAPERARHTLKPRQQMVANPRICSQCLGGTTGREFYVEQAGVAGKMMLCGFRCLAIWAMQRGWQK